MKNFKKRFTFINPMSSLFLVATIIVCGCGISIRTVFATSAIATKETYNIGGTVSGLNSGGQVTLTNNGGDALTLNANGSFSFATPVAYNGSYGVAVSIQPDGQICSLTNAADAGVIADVVNIGVNCTTRITNNFSDGKVAPFNICTYQSPNYGKIQLIDGKSALKFFWDENSWNGTRMTKGVEACSTFNTYKEGWYGFKFYLPSPGYPLNKKSTIAQIFQNGKCNSWAAMLFVDNGSLHLEHRHACSTPVEVIIAGNIKYNEWNPVVIHFVASKENSGLIQVWYGADTNNSATPTYSATNINFGFGTWDGDALASGNSMALKFGQYNWDTTNYSLGETRINYFTDIQQLDGSPTNVWNAVNSTDH